MHYSILVTEISSGRVHSFQTSPGQIFTLYPLQPYTNYRYKVAAVTINGTGPYTRSAVVTTAETGSAHNVELRQGRMQGIHFYKSVGY